MSVVLPDILMPGVVNETISRLKVHNDRLQNFFGDAVNTAGARQFRGRTFSYDVFNATREVANFRAPGAPLERAKPQPVGNVTGRFPRVAFSVPLEFEEIHNLREIGGPANQIDEAGQSYIAEQERIVAQRVTNLRELMWVGMIRNSLHYVEDGDTLIPSLSTGQKIDFQIPAGNLNKADVFGDGAIITDWSNAATDIPAEIEQLDAATEVQTGDHIVHAWLNSNTMRYPLGNAALQARAGTANPIIRSVERVAKNDFTYILNGIPWVVWHVTNGVLNVDGEVTPLFPDDRVLFCPEPSYDWVQPATGSEVVIEWTGRTPTTRQDAYFWSKPTDDPAGYQLCAVMNMIPNLKVPANIYYVDVKT